RDGPGDVLQELVLERELPVLGRHLGVVDGHAAVLVNAVGNLVRDVQALADAAHDLAEVDSHDGAPWVFYLGGEVPRPLNELSAGIKQGFLPGVSRSFTFPRSFPE